MGVGVGVGVGVLGGGVLGGVGCPFWKNQRGVGHRTNPWNYGYFLELLELHIVICTGPHQLCCNFIVFK